MRVDGFGRDLRDAFLRPPAPTLIIEGAYDANWGPEKPTLFGGQHPHAELVVMDSAAHYFFAEQPEEFFGVLENFVRGGRR